MALGILVIIMEQLVSTKADSTGQRIYSAGLVLGILHYMGNGAHTIVILLACLRGQLELLKILMDSGPKQCPPKRGDTKNPDRINNRDRKLCRPPLNQQRDLF